MKAPGCTDLLDKILDGEPFMMVVPPGLRRALRQRARERAREEREAWRLW